ncbi:MAG: hypothetical protein IJI44_02280 [Erysipelotrichaceae bacterium]|nr:hypothetical protein [Erysipelotrichaceae bacterium]
MKRKMDPKNLSGYFIYRDEKNRTYYSLPNSDKGYLIGNSDAYTYYLYQIRPMAATAIPLLAIVFDPSYWKIGIILGIIFYLISTLIFYFAFLKKLPLIDHLNKPQKNSFIHELAENSSIKKLILLFVFCLLMTALFGWLLLRGTELSYLQTTLIAVLVIGYGIYGICQLLALIKKLHK